MTVSVANPRPNGYDRRASQLLLGGQDFDAWGEPCRLLFRLPQNRRDEAQADRRPALRGGRIRRKRGVVVFCGVWESRELASPASSAFVRSLIGSDGSLS